MNAKRPPGRSQRPTSARNSPSRSSTSWPSHEHRTARRPAGPAPPTGHARGCGRAARAPRAAREPARAAPGWRRRARARPSGEERRPPAGARRELDDVAPSGSASSQRGHRVQLHVPGDVARLTPRVAAAARYQSSYDRGGRRRRRRGRPLLGRGGAAARALPERRAQPGAQEAVVLGAAEAVGAQRCPALEVGSRWRVDGPPHQRQSNAAGTASRGRRRELGPAADRPLARPSGSPRARRVRSRRGPPGRTAPRASRCPRRRAGPAARRSPSRRPRTARHPGPPAARRTSRVSSALPHLGRLVRVEAARRQDELLRIDLADPVPGRPRPSARPPGPAAPSRRRAGPSRAPSAPTRTAGRATRGRPRGGAGCPPAGARGRGSRSPPAARAACSMSPTASSSASANAPTVEIVLRMPSMHVGSRLTMVGSMPRRRAPRPRPRR